MQIERTLARFVAASSDVEASPPARRVAKNILLAVSGTAAAGAAEEGCDALLDLLVQRGGREEATVWSCGRKLPATSAAYANGVMSRALDYCDAMAPGLHIGSSLAPAALAVAERRGGCSGTELLAALCVGAEVASRFNLSEAQYAGFDPTGVAGVFGASAAAARLMGLDEVRTRHALSLAFNRCGGSFQSNVDGALAVRFIQGWVAEMGVHCAELAAAGVTGPDNFIEGVYGYCALYGRGTLQPERIAQGLGVRWEMERMMFKRYPSCGLTQGLTHLALRAVEEDGVQPEAVESMEVTLPPYAHRLVGHPFRLGANPRVNAQFSAQFCVANVLVRGSSRLEHFQPEQVADPRIAALISRVRVVADDGLDARGHSAVDLRITTRDGSVRNWSLDIAPGFPGKDLSQEEHRARFEDCLAYASRKLDPARVARWLDAVEGLEYVADIRQLVPLLVAAR